LRVCQCFKQNIFFKKPNRFSIYQSEINITVIFNNNKTCPKCLFKKQSSYCQKFSKFCFLLCYCSVYCLRAVAVFDIITL
jgi:hypothetical protein